MECRQIDLSGKSILVTGGAGFIGAALIMRLLKEMRTGRIVNLDNMNVYYDPELKKHRLGRIRQSVTGVEYEFVRGALEDKELLCSLFEKYDFDIVVNLAAQAGVRYSIDHPDIYIMSNVMGFYNILEVCRHHSVEHLVYASSSSVYGGNDKIPFSVEDKTDSPVSLYAATKKSNELFAHAYSKLYGIPATGLRFFTVYGPAGRPDMFYYSATEKLLAGEKLQIFNYGNCKRDFTFIDDIIEGIFQVMQRPRAGITLHEVYNIGGGTPVGLLEFTQTLHQELINAGLLPQDHDLETKLELVGMQPGDVEVTCADSGPLEREFGCRPQVSIQDGLKEFVNWYKEYRA